MKGTFKLSWRITWYSVVIWVLAFFVASFVTIPWFYVVLPLVVVLTTVYYFKIIDPFKNKRGRRKFSDRDRIFVFGLAVSLFWFLIITILNIFQIAGFYYFNFLFYFSDFRNWFLYALILLIPVIYSLILEYQTQRGRKRKHKISLFDGFNTLKHIS